MIGTVFFWRQNDDFVQTQRVIDDVSSVKKIEKRR
jgi:hypothetical protein